MIKELVYVRWLDAHGSATSAYAEHEIPHAAIEITTYGLLLRDDDKGVSLASEYCADATFRGVTFIPKPMIVEGPVAVLKRPVRRRKARQEVDLAVRAA